MNPLCDGIIDSGGGKRTRDVPPKQVQIVTAGDKTALRHDKRDHCFFYRALICKGEAPSS